jgi:phosphoribosyl-ATP pyrophosphohydrolase/phosphoribosyl-AMP cyclohydrolase
MKPNFEKHSLIPAIIQDPRSGTVLMMAYMNREAYDLTRKSGKVTFYSRSRKTLWTKGETSGNFLDLQEMIADCDGDTILVKAIPTGPVCHTGSDTCFSETNRAEDPFLFILERIIIDRKEHPIENSYTTKLFRAGKKKIAQKVGEEASEVVIEGVVEQPGQLAEECADLLYHTIVLLVSNDVPLQNVLDILRQRHQKKDIGTNLG